MIRIFVGCAPNHEDAESQAVLEWSIRKHSSEPVKIEWMHLSRDPKSYYYSDNGEGWQTSEWATPFSGFRWGIPERCEFQGKALYMDSDIIVMADIAELFHQEFQPGKFLMAKGGNSWRFCVTLFDCAAARKFAMPLHRAKTHRDGHRMMIQELTGSHYVQSFVGDWNCLDGENHSDLKDGLMKALHYTDMSSQPQLRYAIPRLEAQGQKHWYNGRTKEHHRKDVVDLFDEMFKEAIANGFVVDRYTKSPLYGEINKKSLTDYRGSIR